MKYHISVIPVYYTLSINSKKGDVGAIIRLRVMNIIKHPMLYVAALAQSVTEYAYGSVDYNYFALL